MKNIYFVSGTMGVGKSTVCQILKNKLPNCVFLDGDWCWDMHPFQVNDSTKQMVTDNICYLLNNFTACSAFDNIIFCWVMHKQNIIADILSRLKTENCRIISVSLVCSENALLVRLKKDVCAGLRSPDITERSIRRLPLYTSLNTIKLDVSEISPAQAADFISVL